MTSRINMAAVAARIAAEEDLTSSSPAAVNSSMRASTIGIGAGELSFDAGELRSRDLAVSPSSLRIPAIAMGTSIANMSGSEAAETPSKAQQRLWNAQRLDASSVHAGAALLSSPTPSSSVSTTASMAAHVRLGEAKRKMMALRTSVLDALDVLSAQREDATHRIRLLQTNTARNNEAALGAVADFDGNYVHMDAVGRDIPAVMEEAGVELRMPYFDKFGLPVRIPSEEVIAARLGQAGGRLLSDNESLQLCNAIRKDITGVLFPLGDKGLPELICAVNKFTKTDVVSSVVEALAKHDGSLAALDKSIAETEEAIKVAKAKEDFVEAERLTARLLDLSGRRADIRAVQLVLLAGDGDEESPKAASSSAAGFVKSLDQLLYGSAIPTLREEKQQLAAVAKADLLKMAANHARVLKTNELNTARYNLATSESKQRMRDNHARQHAVWDKVLALMEELEGIGQEKEGIVRDHIKVTEAEQLRRQDHREYLDAYRRHSVTLEDLVRNSEVGLKFLGTIADRFQAARVEVESAGVEDRLQAILTEQRKAYLEAFGFFGRGSNAHVARFDQRVANCEHMLKELDFAYKQAPEVGDADKNMYAKRVNDVDRQRRAASGKVEDFTTSYKVREDQFIDIAVRVQASQRARAEKMRAGISAIGGDVTGDEGDLLESLHNTRASLMLQHLDKITAVATRNTASLDAIRQRQAEAESRLQETEAHFKSRILSNTSAATSPASPPRPQADGADTADSQLPPSTAGVEEPTAAQ